MAWTGSAHRLAGSLGLGAGRVAVELAALVRQGGEPRAVVALGGDELARALARLGLGVVSIGPAPRRRKPGTRHLVASESALPLGDDSVDAALSAGLPREPGPALAELSRVVRPGGAIAIATAASALVRRVAPPETLAATLVHAGLVDVEQRAVGSTLITSARVRRRPAR